MTVPQGDRARWTIQEAERLLLSLRGVLSARLVTRPGGEVEEIHILTTEEVAPKQTVQNVESALLASLDLSVDHRKISVAQTRDLPESLPEVEPEPPVRLLPEPPAGEHRLLFQGHQVETLELELALSVGDLAQGSASGVKVGAGLRYQLLRIQLDRCRCRL